MRLYPTCEFDITYLSTSSTFVHLSEDLLRPNLESKSPESATYVGFFACTSCAWGVLCVVSVTVCTLHLTPATAFAPWGGSACGDLWRSSCPSSRSSSRWSCKHLSALWLNKLRSAGLRNRFHSVPFISVAGGDPIAASEALTGSSSSAAPGPFQRGFACLLPLVTTASSSSSPLPP